MIYVSQNVTFMSFCFSFDPFFVWISDTVISHFNIFCLQIYLVPCKFLKCIVLEFDLFKLMWDQRPLKLDVFKSFVSNNDIKHSKIEVIKEAKLLAECSIVFTPEKSCSPIVAHCSFYHYIRSFLMLQEAGRKHFFYSFSTFHSTSLTNHHMTFHLNKYS